MSDTKPAAKAPEKKVDASAKLGEKAKFKTTGAFMLVDPNTGAFIEPLPSAPITVTQFILDEIRVGRVEAA
jgi:hypothetical protein